MYCFFDELLKALNYRDDRQAQLSTAEVMTVALVAAEFFTGNQRKRACTRKKAMEFLTSHKYIKPLSKSRFNRRLHQVPEPPWQLALFTLGQAHQENNPKRLHIVDTLHNCVQPFSVPVCPFHASVKDNIRISRCQIYQDESFRGVDDWCNAALTTASKKEYYYGLKAFLIVTEAGMPPECQWNFYSVACAGFWLP